MSIEEKQLRSKIQYFEDILLRSKNFREQMDLHEKIMQYNKTLAKMINGGMKNDQA